MASDVDNRTFRVIEGKARGLLPFLAWEGALGLAVGALCAVSFHLFVGLVAGGGVLGALIAWRQSDEDRADYVRIWWRRRFEKSRSYSPAESDRKFVPFEGEALK